MQSKLITHSDTEKHLCLIKLSALLSSVTAVTFVCLLLADTNIRETRGVKKQLNKTALLAHLIRLSL